MMGRWSWLEQHQPSLSPAFLGHCRAEAEALSRSWALGRQCSAPPKMHPHATEGPQQPRRTPEHCWCGPMSGPARVLWVFGTPGSEPAFTCRILRGAFLHLLLPACPPETTLSRHHGCRERLTCPLWCQLPRKGHWDGGPDLMAGRTVAGLCWACGSLSC